MSEEKKYDTVETMHGTFRTTLNKMYCNRKPWQPVDPKQIRSFMPGSVIEYKVKAGDRVRKGDTLALFKAMKMNNMILAPMDGTIKALHAVPGENMAKNVLMIEME